VKCSHSPKMQCEVQPQSQNYKFPSNHQPLIFLHGLFSNVGGMLSRYSNSLRARRSTDRFPVRRDFPHSSRYGGVHPACCTMGTGFYQRVKWPEFGADHPSPSKAGLWMGCGHSSAPLLCLHRHAMGGTFTFLFNNDFEWRDDWPLKPEAGNEYLKLNKNPPHRKNCTFFTNTVWLMLFSEIIL